MFMLGCVIHCYTDFKEMLLYDWVSLLMLLFGLLYNFFVNGLEYALWGTAVTGGTFLILFLLYPLGIGQGDVKLAFVLGAWLGWQKGLFCLLGALWLGFIIGMILLVSGLKDSKAAIPFGPYMCLSGIGMLEYGNVILKLYTELF